MLMFTRDYAKHPCTQSVCTLGFAVRPIRPYRCARPHIQGARINTIKIKNREMIESLWAPYLRHWFLSE